ncbi:hypothetical protein JB92DRAFT_2969092 [Gautieria morchelliformis]|nr:hypothetical protein JB92DRAFT_2969092 [Gautieria morchelliformis]
MAIRARMGWGWRKIVRLRSLSALGDALLERPLSTWPTPSRSSGPLTFASSCVCVIPLPPAQARPHPVCLHAAQQRDSYRVVLALVPSASSPKHTGDDGFSHVTHPALER